MQVSAIDVRPGHVLEQDGKLWVVLFAETRNPGKGASVVQIEMRDIRSGIKKDVRFKTQDMVERASLQESDYDFLFSEGDIFTFMDKENFEQITVPRDVIGSPAAFLQEGMVCSIKTHEGTPLAVELPQTVVMTIVEADPVVKGQTASSSYKPAKLENGVKVMVPPFIDSGIKIVVKTADATYVERFKG